jgi:hypothetical protein
MLVSDGEKMIRSVENENEKITLSDLTRIMMFSLPSLSLFSSISTGGFPLNTSISNRTLNHFHKPFTGCLQGILITSFNGQMVARTTSPESSNSHPSEPNYQDFTTFEGENIGECDLFDEFVNSNIIIV